MFYFKKKNLDAPSKNNNYAHNYLDKKSIFLWISNAIILELELELCFEYSILWEKMCLQTFTKEMNNKYPNLK